MAPAKHVRVVVRTRSTADFADNIILQPDGKSMSVQLKRNYDFGHSSHHQDRWDFKFDGYLHNETQEKVYEDCGAPLIRSLLDGYNATVLAYGQTGAGKTYTMTGGANEAFKNRGLVPRAISHLFSLVNSRSDLIANIKISYLEIYNENLIDLLKGGSEEALDSGSSGMSVIEEPDGVVSVKGLSTPIVSNEEEALEMFFAGEMNRTISVHHANKRSSRSKMDSSEKITYAKLNLVDLAGSERLAKTQSEGQTFREATFINKSLSFLEQVILALSDKKRDHVPYRQAKLTHVLRDALGGNCQTLMIANLRCEKQHLDETIATLRFATRMMCVQTTPVVNVHIDPMSLIKKYESEIEHLKQELAMHDTLANRGNISYEPFTDFQRIQLQNKVKAFLDHDQEIEIRELMNQFKILYKNLNFEVSRRPASHMTSHAPSTPGQPNQQNQNSQSSTSGISTIAEKFEEDVNGADGMNDGVGDTEGLGFGIGSDPNAVRSQKPTKARAKPPVDLNNKTAAPAANQQPAAGAAAGQKASNGSMQSTNKINEPKKMASSQSMGLSNAQISGNGPVPQAEPNKPTGRKTGMPTKAEEFEAYKQGRGADISRILAENKILLKEKRDNGKALAESVNTAKTRIDRIMAELEVDNTSDANDTSKFDPNLERRRQELEKELEKLKGQYKRDYAQFKSLKAEIEYCSRLVDQCRRRLVTDFEIWFSSVYGTMLQEQQNLDDNLEGQQKEEQESNAFYKAKMKRLKPQGSSKALRA